MRGWRVEGNFGGKSSACIRAGHFTLTNDFRIQSGKLSVDRYPLIRKATSTSLHPVERLLEKFEV
jgi:hypothetical protein